MRRVVVTGLGLVTPVGNNCRRSWDKLINSISGVKSIDHFETSDLSCKIAGFINHNKDNNNYFDTLNYVSKKDIKKIDRFILYGLAASEEAIKDSGINELSDEEKLKI